MKKRNIAEIGAILYISVLIVIGINIGSARPYVTGVAQSDSKPVVEFSAPLGHPEK
jgi:hypothetical protein